MLESTVDNPASTGSEPAPGASLFGGATQEAQVNQPDDAGANLETEAIDPDEIEEELEGIKLKGKKEALERIKAERLMHQDYTRKTMSHAEERRAFESEREQFKQVAQTAQQMDQERFQLMSLDSRMNQLRQVNFAQLRQQNPELAEQLRDELTQLQAVRPQLADSLTRKHQQMQQYQQQETAKQYSQAQAFLMRELKGWSPGNARDIELTSYAQSQGIAAQRLGQYIVQDPAIAVLIDKAAQWDKLSKERASKPKEATAPKPVSRVEGGRANTTKSPSDMSPEEYVEWRQKRKSGTR